MSKSNLLEHFNNVVTKPVNEHGDRYEIAKCRCNSWFCTDCCKTKGYNLRARLIPILETFRGLIMVTLTIDPELFPDPETAYRYVKDKRCISVLAQALDRRGYLASRQYFYVVEWQKDTQQAHWHILFDSTYIPWEVLFELWSSNRPKHAGPVKDDRPPFGTVHFSAPKFASPVHAARYATKYLTKVPEHGFPDWVLDMGKNRRICRYGKSRGFWRTPSRPATEPKRTRAKSSKTYRERIATCGDSVNVFEMKEHLDRETGEITTKRVWLGQAEANASIIDRLWDPGEPARRRRSLLARSPMDVRRIIERLTGQEMRWRRYRRIEFDGPRQPLFPSAKPKRYPEDYILPGVLSDE